MKAEAAQDAAPVSGERSEASRELKKMLDADPALMALMEESIRLAAEINPDPDTNPVQSIDALCLKMN